MPPQYVCLLHNTTRNQAHGVPNCNTVGCARPMTRVKHWGDYNGVAKHSMTEYTPTTRHVRFDVHLTQNPPYRVFIVIKVHIEFQYVRNFHWNPFRRAEFKRNFKASCGLWDSRCQIQRTDASLPANRHYDPLFFIDWVILKRNAYLTLLARSTDPPVRHAGQLGGNFTDLVSLAGPYSNTRRQPRHGTDYRPYTWADSNGPRTWIRDTTVAAANQEVVNPVAHEFGHFIGIPDEYNDFPAAFSTAMVGVNGRVNRPGTHDGDQHRHTAYWVELLAEKGIASPAWGQFGTGLNQVNEHSIMRNVDTKPASFMHRHYVTVLEAVEHLAAYTTGLQTSTWSIV